MGSATGERSDTHELVDGLSCGFEVGGSVFPCCDRLLVVGPQLLEKLGVVLGLKK